MVFTTLSWPERAGDFKNLGRHLFSLGCCLPCWYLRLKIHGNSGVTQLDPAQQRSLNSEPSLGPRCSEVCLWLAINPGLGVLPCTGLSCGTTSPPPIKLLSHTRILSMPYWSWGRLWTAKPRRLPLPHQDEMVAPTSNSKYLRALEEISALSCSYTIAKRWKQPKCPMMGEWRKKMWSIRTMEYY